MIDPLTSEDYRVGGMTALLDVVGGAIMHTKRVHAKAPKEERPDKVVFVIITDGMENSSMKYTYKDVKHLISHAQEHREWEFIFLGANIDAIDEAAKFGIRRDRAAQYHNDKRGTEKNYEAINEAMTSMRMTNSIKASWKDDIDEDLKAVSKIKTYRRCLKEIANLK